MPSLCHEEDRHSATEEQGAEHKGGENMTMTKMMGFALGLMVSAQAVVAPRSQGKS